MKYTSTRGQAPELNFTQVVTSALASDGGLYLPERFPEFSLAEIQSWKNLPYTELAFNIIKPFVDGEIPDADLKQIIAKSYSGFRVPQVTEIVKLEEKIHVLELFHGPTLAFKDVALQFLGNLQDYILTKQNQDIIIIGATSGDTGSAAIEGVKNCKHIKLFMMHPHGKVSNVQRRQMTTIISPNIHNLAVDGNFDDCQNMVKEMFKNPEFIKGKKLSAVNSINWARIMAQIVYYFQAALQINGASKPTSFAVPSGNFGDILAGYLAKLMGLPVADLIITTNANNILHRFIQSNDYTRNGVKQTLAPSMDIQISSNFERLLYLAHGKDGSKISQMMDKFVNDNILYVSSEVHSQITKTFKSSQSDDVQIKAEIKRVYDKYNYVVCPHTATATRAAEEFKKAGHDVVVLATAHPAKFPDVSVEVLGVAPKLPEHLADLLQKPEKATNLANNIEVVKDFIYKNSI